jgi:restriction system protein
VGVPDFQSLMLPLLQAVADGAEHGFGETVDRLAAEFKLTGEERAEMISSGQRRFDNRVGWAITYLSQSGVLERTGRGRFQIAERGRQILAEKPERIDVKTLQQFPEYQKFKSRTKLSDKQATSPEDETLTPEEVLAESYQELRRDLAAVLLERLRQASPAFLEQLVVELLVAMGYGGSLQDAGKAVGGTGDGGIDGIIKEDRLGLESVYIQAKRWEGTVSRPQVQQFSGALDDKGARKGVFITTSHFSAEAREYAARATTKRIVLIDGDELAQLMMEHGVGVTTVATYAVQKVDLDYFEGIE